MSPTLTLSTLRRPLSGAHVVDNLIPLRQSLAGVQLAGWQHGPPAMLGLGCRLLANQRIPLPDGITLAADVYTPRPAIRVPGWSNTAVYELAPPWAGFLWYKAPARRSKK